MAILPILEYPDPILKTKCKTVVAIDKDILQLLDNLIDTMTVHTGCVGIASPQIGALYRVVVVDCTRGKKPNKNHGLLTLINPVISKATGEQITNEGCLSIPDYIGKVKRATQITVESLTPRGLMQTIEAVEFEAIVLQHEIDHLDGILFLDKVTCLKTDVFRRKIYQ